MDPDAEDFLDTFLPVPKPEATFKMPDFGDESTDIGAFFEKPPVVPKCADPEALIARVRAQVPDADPIYVRELVQESSVEFIDALLGPMSKRARFVRDLLLQHRSITTEQVKAHYDPMAIRDLEERGIPLHRSPLRGTSGRATTRYELDSALFLRFQESRLALPSKERNRLFEHHGLVCKLCGGSFSHRVLEADHRIPFVLVGNTRAREEGWAAFQPLCPSCNTAKDSACAECPNQDPGTCRTCYWAYPEDYTHIATRHERRLILVATTPEQMAALVELEAEARRRGF